MRTLNDVMREAGEEIRALESGIPDKRWSGQRAVRRHRSVAAFAGAAVVVVAIGLPTMWLLTPNGGNQPVGSPGLEQPETSGLPETDVASNSSATTVVHVETTVTQEQTPVGEHAYLFPSAAGWTLNQGTVRDGGQSVSMTLSNGTTEVVFELMFGTGVEGGAWRKDFMVELEAAGVAEMTEFTVRGREAVLWVTGTDPSAHTALEWVEAPGTLAVLFTLSGPAPEPMIELAESLKPISHDEWAAMIASFNGADEPSDTAEDTTQEGG